ncbi:MAG: hypothetical protein GY787_01660 [Alteromonadales bacterium]|nr:hypothetical protein [Alteromonadales bacterium]
MCQVKVLNNINYGTPQAVTGNLNIATQFPTGNVNIASISTNSNQSGKVGGIVPTTDNGGNHAGLSGYNGAQVSKVTPGYVTKSA